MSVSECAVSRLPLFRFEGCQDAESSLMPNLGAQSENKVVMLIDWDLHVREDTEIASNMEGRQCRLDVCTLSQVRCSRRYERDPLPGALCPEPLACWPVRSTTACTWWLYFVVYKMQKRHQRFM